MRILFNDIIQNSSAKDNLKSAALSDIEYITNPLIITFNNPVLINSIGIGNTNGTFFNVTFNNSEEFHFEFEGNGLYFQKKIIETNQLIINTDANFIGRIGAGIACNIPTAIAKEPTFNSTNEPRYTLSGQVISGIGGYNYKSVSLDSRYKIDEFTMNEILKGYITISKGFPFFIDLTVESYKLPFKKLYATERNQLQMGFESGVKKYLYSRRFNFEEKF